jgi:hypothetical protein
LTSINPFSENLATPLLPKAHLGKRYNLNNIYSTNADIYPNASQRKEFRIVE